MTTETMTVYKALCELKLLDSRINKEICRMEVCAAVPNSANKILGVSRKTFEENVRADFDSVRDLIRRRSAIKRAVVISNATTLINVSGDEMTVAEAIEMKTHGMLYTSDLLNKITSEYASAKLEADRSNRTLDDRAEKFLLSMYDKKEIKVGNDEIDAVRKNYIDKNSVSVIDPLMLESVMKQMRDTTDAFNAEFDSALSVSNATTSISITY